MRLWYRSAIERMEAVPRAEPVMFGRAEPPIFLDRRMAAGVVNGDHDVTGILLGADADKRRAVRTFPTGVEGIFQKIAEDRAELWLTQRERGRKLDADRKNRLTPCAPPRRNS